jgi:hypothetical protein
MPRDSSGNYTLPLGNPVIPNTVIETEWANSTMSDIAAQLNNVLTRDGIVQSTAPTKFVDGTLAAPGAAFQQAPGTGFYRTLNYVGCTWNGVEIFKYNASEITFNKPVKFSSTAQFVTEAYFTPDTLTSGIIAGYDPTRISGFLAFITKLDFYTALEDTLPNLVLSPNGPVVTDGAAWYGRNGVYFYGAEGDITPALSFDPSGNVSIAPATSRLATYQNIEIGFRKIPINSLTGGALVSGNRGKCVADTENISIPNGVFSSGDVITIFCYSTYATISITPAVGITMYKAGSLDTGPRTLAPNGLATILFITDTLAVISGTGLS